jgi:hypothetical protein
MLKRTEDSASVLNSSDAGTADTGAIRQIAAAYETKARETSDDAGRKLYLGLAKTYNAVAHEIEETAALATSFVTVANKLSQSTK